MTMTPPPLTGFIVHRLDLSDDSSDWSTSKKKRRRQDSKDKAADSLRRAGFFLVPSDASSQQEFLLVSPQSLFKQVCDAARFKHCVRITKYSVISIETCSREPQHEQVSVHILELFSEGLEVQPSDNNSNKTNACKSDNALTLTQFRALERSFSNKKQAGNTCTRKLSSKDAFTITATVDAVSPIIAAVPSDPFALMELYEPPGDSNVPPNSCVAVLKGSKALVCHAGIQPGDNITLRHVRRKKWEVPGWFAKKGPARLVSRAPIHLFVVTDASSICWETSIEPRLLPSTAVPLVAAQGTIVSVDTRPVGPNDSNVIYSVKLCRSGVQGASCKQQQQQQDRATETLYVSHYPMSPELLMGIRPGATLRAINIHNLHFSNPHVLGGQTNYGACLRSTISLLRCASEMESDGAPMTDAVSSRSLSFAAGEHDNTTRRPFVNDQMSIQLLTPFVFGEFHRQYRQSEFRRHLKQCKVAERLCSLEGARDQELSSLDELEKIMIQHCTNTQTKNKRKRKRDPYAEFFDHACDTQGEASGSDTGLTGCLLSPHSDELIFPTFVDLGDIHNVCIAHLKSKLELLLSSSDGGKRRGGLNSSMQGGWTGSFRLGPEELNQYKKSSGPNSGIQQETRENEAEGMEHRVVVCSTVASIDDNDKPTSLADSEYQLPVSFVNAPTQTAGVAATVVTNVHDALISCLCLGTSAAPVPKEAAEMSSNFNVSALPLCKSCRSPKDKKGSCVLIECCGLLFIASIQVRCGFLTAFGLPKEESATKSSAVDFYEKTMRAKRISSVRECLCRDKKISKNPDQSFSGLLVRQRFRFVKIRSGSFLGCVLTLSHLPDSSYVDYIEEASVLTTKLSTMQSIELKLSISFPNGQLEVLKKSMRKLLGDNAGSILQEQSDLAAAWWRISDSALASSLVSNGLDDFIPQGQRGTSRSLLVPVAVVPCIAVREGGHGYLRFQCNLDDMRSSFIEVIDDSRPRNLIASTESLPKFDAVGGLKFFTGSLDRHPRRRYLYDQMIPPSVSGPSRRITGELLSVPSDIDSGVSASTLADLHWKICADMRKHTQSQLAPSMVRVIRNATLLSLSFCRALAECTKCFQPLKQRKSRSNKREDSPVSGVVSSVQVDKKKTYWHLPFPMVGSRADDASHARQASENASRPHTMLVCPNGCSLEHARIKWECSGLIDDGSGQAKLYSEREAALSLLGADLRVHDIEAGAWRTEGGILFQKAVPPKSFVKQAVLEAQSLARQEMNRRAVKKRRKLVDEDVIKFLTTEARAEYYMQHHCRHSFEPTRLLDYYVRCKPLSKEATHLNQTHVEMAVPPAKDYMQASTMDVTTYTLPPLKLTLVDCSVPQYSAVANDTDASWDLVGAMANETR